MSKSHDGEGEPGELTGDLRSQLAKQVKEIERATRSSGGKVPEAALANAQRLTQLAQLQRQLVPPRHVSRWGGAALFTATVAIASVLLLARVGETEVDLDLVVSELRFDVESRQQLTDMQQLASLGAAGLSNVAVPGGPGAGGEAATGARVMTEVVGTRGATVAAEIAKFAGAARQVIGESGVPAGASEPARAASGTISLAPIVAPAHAAVTLNVGDVPGEMRLSINHADGPFRADVSGAVTLAVSRKPLRTLQADTPQSIVLTPGTADVDLDLLQLSSAPKLFASELKVTELSLTRVDEVSEDDKTTVRRASTLQSGSIFLEDLGGRELKIRAQQALRFTQARGEIRSVGLSDGRLAVNFHGHVRGMSSGSFDHPRSLMPSWLDWLRANQPLSLLWGAAVYLFGLSTAVRQWWKKND